MSRAKRFLSGHRFVQTTTLDASGEQGQIGFKDGVLYVYTTLNGVTTWYPINRPQTFYVHNQGLAATTWTINHGLDTKEVIVGVYDDAGYVIDAQVQNLQDGDGNWYTVVTFTEAEAGYAVVFGRETLSAPNMEARQINASESMTVAGVNVATVDDLSGKLDVGAVAYDSSRLGGRVAADYLTVDDTLDFNA